MGHTYPRKKSFEQFLQDNFLSCVRWELLAAVKRIHHDLLRLEADILKELYSRIKNWNLICTHQELSSLDNFKTIIIWSLHQKRVVDQRKIHDIKCVHHLAVFVQVCHTEEPKWVIWLIWAIVGHYTDKKTHFLHIFESFCLCTDPLRLKWVKWLIWVFCACFCISENAV